MPHSSSLENENPVVYAIQEKVFPESTILKNQRYAKGLTLVENFLPIDQISTGETTCIEVEEPLTAQEIFDLIKNINDPEHPLTLEQLHVVQEELISVSSGAITVRFTPTIPHCSMATLIGLSIRVKLFRSLSSKYKVHVRITEGTHQSENAVNKQLNDKERVAAAMENKHLLEVINQCLARSVSEVSTHSH